jgi:hypothetical protein
MMRYIRSRPDQGQDVFFWRGEIMLATKDCQAFTQALEYWNEGNHAQGGLVRPESVVETRIPLEKLMSDLGEPVDIGTPAGRLHSWPNVRLGGRDGILFAMEFGGSCAVHFAAQAAERQHPG